MRTKFALISQKNQLKTDMKICVTGPELAGENFVRINYTQLIESALALKDVSFHFLDLPGASAHASRLIRTLSPNASIVLYISSEEVLHVTERDKDIMCLSETDALQRWRDSADFWIERWPMVHNLNTLLANTNDMPVDVVNCVIQPIQRIQVPVSPHALRLIYDILENDAAERPESKKRKLRHLSTPPASADNDMTASDSFGPTTSDDDDNDTLGQPQDEFDQRYGTDEDVIRLPPWEIEQLPSDADATVETEDLRQFVATPRGLMDTKHYAKLSTLLLRQIMDTSGTQLGGDEAKEHRELMTELYYLISMNRVTVKSLMFGVASDQCWYCGMAKTLKVSEHLSINIDNLDRKKYLFPHVFKALEKKATTSIGSNCAALVKQLSTAFRAINEARKDKQPEMLWAHWQRIHLSIDAVQKVLAKNNKDKRC